MNLNMNYHYNIHGRSLILGSARPFSYYLYYVLSDFELFFEAICGKYYTDYWDEIQLTELLVEHRNISDSYCLRHGCRNSANKPTCEYNLRDDGVLPGKRLT